jgi:hypothetical protein
MNKILLTIRSKGEGYTSDVILHDDGSVSWFGDMDIDCDGSGGNPHHDRFFQPDTTLHHDGKALNAEVVPFIVVPPEIIRAVPGIVMGCSAFCKYNNKSVPCIVGDQGPFFKLGEASPELARRLGINDNPNTGGLEVTQRQIDRGEAVLYTIWPGFAGDVDGVRYELQPA